jgi:hypothetical protein
MRYHWKTLYSTVMLGGRVTNSVGYGDTPGQDNGVMTTQTKQNEF